MDPKVAGFDWDEANRGKCQKHGVSVDEIEAAFQKPIAVVPDPRHSQREERFKAIGITDRFYAPGAQRRKVDPADQRPLHAPKGGCIL
jgi:ribonuclease toxin BrnT of type II toxin-antitoxin system